MPIIILILSTLGAAIWWWVRSNPRDALDIAGDTVTTVKNAPRRLAFRRQTNIHPVDSIDDPEVAVGTMAMAFLGLDDLPTKDQYDRLHVLLRSKLRCSEDDAKEIQVYGRWVIQQCGGELEAFNRVARRLKKLNGADHLDIAQDIFGGLAEDRLSERQKDAVTDMMRIFPNN
ncbi:hypothetical protein [Yoonia sp. SS1-5]|uniref:Co-chaperone DjlA N-terminal domain-containing protein n=2 Tax=Yoonia rhodophyticola TaxID=3137370 RepID=A0ABZ3JCJ9_9RHOB